MEIEDTEQEILLEPEMYAEVGDGILTIQKNNENIGTFNANSFTDETINIEVPVKTSELENDSGYQTGSEVESAISTAVGAEATLRENADTALGGRIDNLVTGLGDETTARQNADNGLQGQIDAITASSDVTDIVGTKAQLNNYDTSKLNDNDIIKVLQDESQNDETTYYRWSTATQSFSLIGEEGPYYTKAESNVLLQGKQDVLTAGTNINITNNVISATDTTYSAGNAITIDANNEISADIYPADYFTAEASMTETGTTIQFDDTIPATMSFDNLYGDSEQQTYTGKNLVDALNVTWTEINSTLTKTDGVFKMIASSETLARCCLPLSGLVEGTTYTFSCDIHGVSISSILNTSYLRVRETSSGGSWVSEASYITQTSDYVRASVTFTATSVSNPYVWFYISANASNTNNIEVYAKNLQFEVGSTDTDYEPYVGGIPSPNPEYPQNVHTVTGVQTFTISDGNSNSRAYTVDLGAIELVKIDDYQDYIYKNGVDWYVHKEVSKIDIDSTIITAYNTHNGSHITVNYPNVTIKMLSSPAVTNFSNRFIGCTSTQTWGGTVINGVAQGTNNNYLQFSLPLSAGSSQAEVRTYFSNHPTTVYYVLETATDTKITDTSLIAQLDALSQARSYYGATSITITATSTNLPVSSKITVFKNSASGIIKVLENAVTSAELDSRLGGLTLLPISQTDYDNLQDKDPNTLYVITGA